MPKSGWRNRHALIVTTVALISIVLICWIENTSPHSVGAIEQNAKADNRGPSEGFWWPEIAARDTYAQWATAFFTLISTGVSIWAVRLVREQLILNREATEAAIEAVGVAREAAGSGRAWLLYSSWNYLGFTNSQVRGKLIKDGIGFSINLMNFGNSPALKVRFVTTHRIVDHDDSTPFFPSEDNPVEQDIGAVVSQQTSVGTEHVILSDEETVLIKTFQKSVDICCVATYRDVFNPEIGRRTILTFRYTYNGSSKNPDGSPGVIFTVAPLYQNTAS